MTEGLKNWSLDIILEQGGEAIHSVKLANFDRAGIILELTRALALTETRLEKESPTPSDEGVIAFAQKEEGPPRPPPEENHQSLPTLPNSMLPVCIFQCSCQECYYKGIRCKKTKELCSKTIGDGKCPEGKKLQEESH